MLRYRATFVWSIHSLCTTKSLYSSSIKEDVPCRQRYYTPCCMIHLHVAFARYSGWYFNNAKAISIVKQPWRAGNFHVIICCFIYTYLILGIYGWGSKFETTECRTTNISKFQNYFYF